MRTVLFSLIFALALVACDDDDSNNTNNTNNTNNINNTNNTNNVNNTNNTNNVNAICGDGVLEGDEVCDDGNLNGSDGCNAMCTIEPGWTCTTDSPSICTANATCGDGQLGGTEVCDDGNTDPDDGCDANCMVEVGWSCDDSSPSVCNSGCGDGVLVGVEGCDDGNNDAGDGCSPTCMVETGWTCTTDDPSVCTPICGDGLIMGDEECDGTDLDGFDCISIDQGFTQGTLACSDTCMFDTAACEAVCPGTILPSTSEVYTDDMCAVGTHFFYPYVGMEEGPEMVLEIALANNEQLTAVFNSDGDGVLYLLDDCFDFEAQAALEFIDTNTATPFVETLTYTQHGGAGTVYLVADIYDNDCSSPVNFTLSVDIQ